MTERMPRVDELLREEISTHISGGTAKRDAVLAHGHLKRPPYSARSGVAL